MSYFTPYVDASGYHMPTYQDIEDKLVADTKAIYGDDVYLENDSQDFQLIAARAQMHYDSMLSVHLAYNSRSPRTAIGVGLDGVVAINGLSRHGKQLSSVPVNITGSPNITLPAGVIADHNGYLWDVPSVTLDNSGNGTVTAFCQSEGAITALPNTITIIMTPTQGWTSVNNPIAAVAGVATESDANLSARQAVSVMNPAQSLTESIQGGILAVDGVQYVKVYENDTKDLVYTINDVQKLDGFYPNSLTIVVKGGVDIDVASAYAKRKTPGAYSAGDTRFNVYDRYGTPKSIGFYRPVEVPIHGIIHIERLTGYNAAIGNAAHKAVVNYINSLEAGQTVIISELWQAALEADPNKFPVFSLQSIEVGTLHDYNGFLDIAMLFNQKATATLSTILLSIS